MLIIMLYEKLDCDVNVELGKSLGWIFSRYLKILIIINLIWYLTHK